MEYRIFSILSGEEQNSIEAHVLARAYRAVWRCTHGSEPTGRHHVAGLELALVFGGRAAVRVGTLGADAASTARAGGPFNARYSEPASAAVDVPPEGDTTTDLWTRVRLFGKRMPSRELEQLLADLRAKERLGNSGSAEKREQPHPMKRRATDSPETRSE